MEYLKRNCQMDRLIIVLLFAAMSVFSFSQENFEGRVIYKYQILNPNQNLISDEDFYASIPNEGISKVVLYIKGNKYRYEYPDRIEIFVPSKNAIAQYPADTNLRDSTYYMPAAQVDEKMQMERNDETDEKVMKYSCKSVSFKNKWGSYTYFYNSDVLKTNSSFWRGHRVNGFSEFTKISSSFPLMILKKSMLGNYGMMAIKIEEVKVEDEVFEIE